MYIISSSTTIVLRKNQLTRPDSHYTSLCKNCCDKETNIRYSARKNISGVSKTINKRQAKWHGTSDDEQEPSLQQCKAHNVKVVTFYCENHKKLICDICLDTSHQTCENTQLPGKSSTVKRFEETSNNIEPGPITIKTGIKQKQNEHVLLTGISRDTAAKKRINLIDMNILKTRKIEIFLNVNSAINLNVSCSTFLHNGDLVIYCVSEKHIMLYNSSFRLKSSFKMPSEESFSLFSCDMCITSMTEIAITEPKLHKIYFVTTEPEIHVNLEKSIKLDNPCYGIDCYLDMLYVISEDTTIDKREILVITTGGEIQKRLELDNDGGCTLRSPRRIRVSQTSGRIFVADTLTHIVTCLTQSGDVVYVYRHQELREPSDVYVDSEDNIIVCGYLSHNVHRVDKKGNHHSTLLSKSDGVSLPRSLAYRCTDSALAVVMNGKPSFMVFWLQ